MTHNYEKKYLDADQRAISLRVDLQRSQKLLDDAGKEITRLRALVRSAYLEGVNDVCNSLDNPDRLWERSSARRALSGE